MTGQSPPYDTDRHAHILALHLAHIVAAALDLVRSHNPGLARARELAHVLDHNLDLAYDFARDLTLARDLDFNPNFVRGLARDPVLVLDLVLHQALHQINAFIDRWEQVDASAEAKQSLTTKEESAPIAHLAEHLVGVMMRLLPAGHRNRYTEELKAELHDLAQVKATKVIQVMYALQQLGRVLQLRAALLTPEQLRFHRLHRAARWVLATETRTWTPLTGLLLWSGVETALDTGLGAAILTVVSGGAVFHAGVTWGRNRLGVKIRRWKSAKRPDPPEGR